MKKVFADINVRPMTPEEKQMMEEKIKAPSQLTNEELNKEILQREKAADLFKKKAGKDRKDNFDRLSELRTERKTRIQQKDKAYFMCTLSSLLGGNN